MLNFLTPHKTFSLALLLTATSLCSWAGDGHDHGDAPAVAAASAMPRFTATSKTFELVGVVNGKHIALYLDHAADNSPAKDATLALELGGSKVVVKPHGEGEFEAMLAADLQPGEVRVSATAVEASVTELLAGDLDVHADTLAPAAEPGPGWKTYGVWAAVGLLALAMLAFALRHVGALRNNRAGGAA